MILGLDRHGGNRSAWPLAVRMLQDSLLAGEGARAVFSPTNRHLSKNVFQAYEEEW